jgi:transposase-like protein
MKKKRKAYSRDFKVKLVELCKSRANVSSVSREYGHE